MNESDLDRVDKLESNRLNGPRVKRLTREMYCSATDPTTIAHDLFAAIGAALIAIGGGLALIATALAA